LAQTGFRDFFEGKLMKCSGQHQAGTTGTSALAHSDLVTVALASTIKPSHSAKTLFPTFARRGIGMAIGLAVLIGLATPSASAEPPKPTNREQAVAVIRELRRIVTPLGIDQSLTIPIGGINQAVTIRGRDRRNPILLVLHGGPGFPETALAWWNTRDLEEYFTVVHWDQRGSGKTFLINDAAAVAPTMQPERFIADTQDLVGWLRKQFGKEKIFLLGHSWGSYVGLEFALRHAEELYAYIGVGQATNTPESERRGYAFALAAARRAGNAEAIAQLESIAPYAVPGQAIPLEKIVIERRWSDYFGGVMAYREGQVNGVASRLSPEYSDDQAPHVYDGNSYSQLYLFSTVLSIDLGSVAKLGCPLILLEGRHDRTVNSEVAHEWFEHLQAPKKTFVWFEHSGHEVMSEEPGKVLVSLLRFARPIAERVGDVAPN
jgi:pimeloyl-ACP methyl ester carboxylesterase